MTPCESAAIAMFVDSRECVIILTSLEALDLPYLIVPTRYVQSPHSNPEVAERNARQSGIFVTGGVINQIEARSFSCGL